MVTTDRVVCFAVTIVSARSLLRSAQRHTVSQPALLRLQQGTRSGEPSVLLRLPAVLTNYRG